MPATQSRYKENDMKRKLIVLIAALLVVSLLATVLLVACDPKDKGGEEGKEPTKPTGNLTQTSTALPAVIKNIYATYKNVKFDGTAPLGIDAAIGVVVDGVTYDLVAKGNLDLTKSNTEDKSELFIAVNKTDGGKENLFSLAYDVPSIENPYLYIGSSSAGYFKTKGLSISEMLYDLDHQQHAPGAAATSAETAEGEEEVDLIDTIAELAGGLLGSAIFGTTAQMNPSATGGVQYVFTLDVQYMLSTFGSQITSLLGLVEQFLGESINLDDYIGPVVDGIANLLPDDKTAIVGTAENPVKDASTKLGNLFKVLAQKMGNASDAKANNIVIKLIVIKLTFDFNKDNTFAGAVIDVDASKFVAGLNAEASEEDKIDFDGKVQIRIDRLVINNDGVSDPFLEADAGLKALIADTDAEAHNFLDFDFEIAAEGADDNYVIKADFDLDPFVLTEMMKYSDQTKGTDGKYAQSAQGQEFWKGKMADALAKAGTATIIVTKNGDTGSTFDRPVEGVDKTSVIAYGKIDSKEIDVFVWDPANNKEVTFGDLTFPLSWDALINKLAKPVQAGASAEGDTATALIQEIFGYVGDIFPLLDTLLAEIKTDEATGSLTLGYASVIKNVVWPILDIFVAEADSGWIDANLNNLLATIFGSVTDGVADPADSVTFTLKSFNYCGKAIDFTPAAE